jgi:hypothetical protein
MSIQVGTKVFDEERPGVFGIVWKIRAGKFGPNCQVRWSDKSVDATALDALEGFGIYADDEP